MDNIDLYFSTKNISYLHEWVSENYKLFYTVVDKLIKRHTLYEVSRDDLFQEAVIAFYAIADKYNPELGNFVTFVFGAIQNELLNSLKHKQRIDFGSRVNAISIDQPLESDEDSTFGDIISANYDDDFIKGVLLNDLKEFVLTKCNIKTQKIFKLYCEGYKYEEIGKMLGISKQRAQQIIKTLTLEVRDEWRV